VFIANFVSDALMLLIWLAATLILWCIAKVKISYFGTILKLLMGVSIFIIVVQGFMYRGETPIFVIGHLEIWGGADLGVFTLEGLTFGIALVIRIVTAVCAIPLVTMTTSPSKLMESLTKLKIPFSYTFMLVTAMKFTPTVQEIWRSIIDAQKIRGFDFDKMNIFKKLGAYIPILIPLILISLRKANDLEVAIESRAFGAPIKRTFVEDVSFHRTDMFFICIFIALFVSCIFFKLFYAPSLWNAIIKAL
jgi:energy-coupling factor transport system permease protein